MTRLDFNGSVVIADHLLTTVKVELAQILARHASSPDWTLASTSEAVTPDEVAL